MAHTPELVRAAALFEHGKLDLAARLCERMLASGEVSADAQHLAGLVFFERGERERGIELLRRALQQNPENPSAHANLASCLSSMGHFSEALEHAEEAFRTAPASALANTSLAAVYLDTGAVSEALVHFRGALSAEPSFKVASNILYAEHFVHNYPQKRLYEEHRAFAKTYEPPVYRLVGHDNAPDPERRLRVGYLSADMYSHSVAHFLAPLLASHDRAAVEVQAFPSVERPDAVTERLRGLCDHWAPVTGLSDDEAAATIRAAGIDVLVELGGHTGKSRLLVAARRPAPVQVSWLGYPDTTGLDAIGYRLTDAWVDPEGAADTFASESLVRLSSGFLCYEAPVGAPEVSPSPSGPITFGSFNTLSKVTPNVIETWARILKKVEGSRLVLKGAALSDEGVQARVRAQLVERGITPDRLLLLGRTLGQLDHLARYAEIDVALDPFPYSGTTTTCEALWMGVPVIALEGDRHAARVSTSILRRMGLDSLVATSTKQYVSIAERLARDRTRLGEMRAEMRGKMKASSVCNAAAFARAVEDAYRAMWRSFCAKATAEPKRISIGPGGSP